MKQVPDFMEEYIIDALNDEHFIISQFTGLYDKNGKEIWEGDVFMTENNCKGIVKYEDGCFVTEIPPSERFDYERVDPLYYAVNMGIEVIGNIYENPELLEEE